MGRDKMWIAQGALNPSTLQQRARCVVYIWHISILHLIPTLDGACGGPVPAARTQRTPFRHARCAIDIQYVYIYMYIYIKKHTYIYKHMNIHIYLYICICIYMNIYKQPTSTQSRAPTLSCRHEYTQHVNLRIAWLRSSDGGLKRIWIRFHPDEYASCMRFPIGNWSLSFRN